MKLADFFVALGFDITGAPELKDLDKQLGSMMGSATKLLAVFGSMTTAMGLMLNQAMNSAEGFRRFEAVTGLSANKLKSWEYAAKLAGVESEDLTNTIKSLQQARADIMMGTGNVAPWQLLGIAPSEDPFETLKQLKERIKDLDPAVARSIAGQMGVSEGVFAMLRLSNKEFDELEKKFQLTSKQQKALTETNIAWAKFRFEVSAVKDRIVSELVPALTPLIHGLERVVKLFASFAQWLSKGSAGAKVVRVVLITVAAAIVAITVALTLLVGVLGLATAAMAALDLAASPLLPVIWGITAAVLAVVAVVTAAVLIIQDLWTAMNGGDSMLGPMMEKFKLLKIAIEAVLGPLLRLMQIYMLLNKYEDARAAQPANTPEAKKLKEISWWQKALMMQAAPMMGLGLLFGKDPKKQLEDSALTPNKPQASNSSIRQENNIDINVNGGPDPYATGRAVADPLKQALSDAAYQLPVPA